MSIALVEETQNPNNPKMKQYGISVPLLVTLLIVLELLLARKNWILFLVIGSLLGTFWLLSSLVYPDNIITAFTFLFIGLELTGIIKLLDLNNELQGFMHQENGWSVSVDWYFLFAGITFIVSGIAMLVSMSFTRKHRR